MSQVNKIQRVLVTAGGTGGHVFPALAAAKYFQQQGVEVRWVGTRQGIEARIIPQHHIDIEYLDIAGVRGQGIKRMIFAPLKISKSIWQVIKIARQYKPDLVLGMGGFVTGPTGIAMWLSGCPVFVHEQNAVAGFTNKMLAKIAIRIFQAFPGAFPEKNNVETTGNPVREEIAGLGDPNQRYQNRHGALRVLILGGSQGAVALNNIVPKALSKLRSQLDIEIKHQAGPKNIASAKACYVESGVNAEIIPFIDDMASAYAWADLVICRSGALTVSEIAAAGVASLLIPYPYAVDDHQTKNAEYLSKQGAAILVQQNELDENKLSELILSTVSKRDDLREMAINAKHLAMIDATSKLVSRCMEVTCGSK